MPSLSKLFVELGLNDKGFSSGLSKAGGAVGSLGKIAGIGLVGVGVAAAAAGVELFKIGSEWDSASDLIVTKTGATGDAFTTLSNTTKSVFGSIPTDMETAASAVADLSVKTGATGDALDSLAKSEIELARITGTDLNANIDASAKIFNAFGVETENQTKTLDQFFRASQSSGMGVDVLMASVQQFAPVLQAMGLGAGESANLIGKLDKAGLHTTVVMQGFKKSLGVFAKAGVSDVKAGMTDVFNSIKNAGSSADATAIAMKYFGAKAGPELAQAILDGKISVDDLTGSLDENGQSILDTAASTNDFAENLKIFKNNLQLALIPLGTLVFAGVNLLIPLMTVGAQWVGKFAESLSAAFSSGTPVAELIKQFPEPLQGAARGFLLIADAIGDLVHSFQAGGFEEFTKVLPQKLDQIKQGLTGLASEGFNALASAVGSIDWSAVWSVVSNVGQWLIGRLGDVTADLAQWASDEIGDIDWSAVWAVVSDVGLWLLDRLGDIATDIGTWAYDQIVAVDWSAVWDGIQDVGLFLIDKYGDIYLAIGTWAYEQIVAVDWGAVWDGISDVGLYLVDKMGEIASNLFTWAQEQFTGVDWVEAAGDLSETLKPIGEDLLQGLADGAEATWELLKTWIGNRGINAQLAIGSLLTTLKQSGKDLLQGLADGADQIWKTLKTWISNRGLNAKLAIGSLISTLLQSGKDLLTGLYDGAKTIWTNARTWLSNRGTNAANAVGALGSYLLQAGRDLIQGLIDGIQEKIPFLDQAVGGINFIIDKIDRGNSPWPMMIEAGSDAIDGLVIGMMSKKSGLATAVNSINGVVNGVGGTLGTAPGFSGASFSGSAGTATPQPIYVSVQIESMPLPGVTNYEQFRDKLGKEMAREVALRIGGV